VEDLKSTNGLLLNGIRTSGAVIRDGDTITFGGAKSTPFNQRPKPTAKRSIYAYSIHGLFAGPDAPEACRCGNAVLVQPSAATPHETQYASSTTAASTAASRKRQKLAHGALQTADSVKLNPLLDNVHVPKLRRCVCVCGWVRVCVRE